MLHPSWPLFGLRLVAGDLELRPVTEPDLPRLADMLPDDYELNPEAPTYPGLDARVARGVVLVQSCWAAYGTWTPDAWRLPFAVRRAGELVGLQELEGNRGFRTLRTVHSASWLTTQARGRGTGRRMRAAVLSLAFERLGALAAASEGWHDNAASLGVSRALGYRPDGEFLHVRDGRVEVMVRMRLRRADWLARGAHLEPVQVDGFDACRPLFGL